MEKKQEDKMDSTRKRIEDLGKLVGSNIRIERIINGLSLNQVSKKTGVSCQQFSKYEKGVNRISVGVLYLIAETLNKPISYFYNSDIAELETGHDKALIEAARGLVNIKNQLHIEAIQTPIRSLSDV